MATAAIMRPPPRSDDRLHRSDDRHHHSDDRRRRPHTMASAAWPRIPPPPRPPPRPASAYSTSAGVTAMARANVSAARRSVLPIRIVNLINAESKHAYQRALEGDVPLSLAAKDAANLSPPGTDRLAKKKPQRSGGCRGFLSSAHDSFGLRGCRAPEPTPRWQSATIRHVSRWSRWEEFRRPQ